MLRATCRAIPVLALCAGVLAAAGQNAERQSRQEQNLTKPAEAKIVKVDAKNGTITVRMKNPQGKEAEKTFQLSRDVRIVDETGKVVAIDVFESGVDALVIETEGRLREL